jgi:ABC-type transport system substrate-binding protein
MQIYQGLFDLDEGGHVIPNLIEKWTSVDQRTWIFHVRKGVYFHESPIFKGKARDVTAKDVVYSLTQYCAPNSYNAFLMTDSVLGAAEYNQGKIDEVKGFEVVDNYTVKIELIRPERFFINRISTGLITVYPEELASEEFVEQAGFSIAVGTGPYKLKSRTETEIILEKNENYWNSDQKPQIDTLIFRVISNDQTRLANLQRNNVNMMVLPSVLFPAVLEKDGGLKPFLKKKYTINTAETFNTHFIGINNKMIPDMNLRRAMLWGTNRKEMIDAVLYGYAKESVGTVPDGLNGYVPPNMGDLFDQEKAKDFLAKSSYSGESIELYVHNLANSEQVGQIFQAQMAQIGINITLVKLNFNGVIDKIIKGEAPLFSMFLEYVFSSPEPILINMFASWKIPVPNFFQFSNEAVDQQLNSLYELGNAEEAVKVCSTIEEAVMADAPALFLYQQKYVIISPNNLKGVAVSGNNHYFFEKMEYAK